MWLTILGAVMIGLTLGLLGSGGSILTVPVLVYLVGQPEKVAIASSLAIVGGISLVGAMPRMFMRDIDWRSVIWFGLPGMLGTLAGSVISRFIPGAMQLFIFAVVMLIAATLMLRPSKPRPLDRAPRARHRIVLDGFAVGVLTGLIGIGGGFLILPALVLLGGLSMHRAVGTSLVIIALNAFSGFAKHSRMIADAGLTLDWKLIGIFTAIGAIGSLIGMKLSARLPQQRLRQLFAIFLVLMGAFIVTHTLPQILSR